jgi:hypothetical protein
MKPRGSRHDARPIERAARELGQAIGESLPEGVGFALTLFDFGAGGMLAYVSNAQREDMIRALREQIERLESGVANTRGASA